MLRLVDAYCKPLLLYGSDVYRQWRHQLWGTGARAPPLELVQVVIFTLHVCSVVASERISVGRLEPSHF